MLGRHDRQETKDEEQQAIKLLNQEHDRFTALPSEMPDPAPGSVLQLEQRHTARQPIHTMVLSHRARATDNIARLFNLTLDLPKAQVRAYPFSGYSLIRTAVESAAVGLWLIQPNRKATRVLRALQSSKQHEYEAIQFIEMIRPREVAAAARERHEQILSRLEELKNTVPPLRQREIGPVPSYTEILASVSARDSQDRTRYDIHSPLLAWKISSSFIHGSEVVTRALSDMRQTTEFEDGIAQFEITPSLRLTAVLTSTCVSLIRDLDERYLYLASHDPGGRRIDTLHTEAADPPADPPGGGEGPPKRAPHRTAGEVAPICDGIKKFFTRRAARCPGGLRQRRPSRERAW